MKRVFSLLGILVISANVFAGKLLSEKEFTELYFKMAMEAIGDAKGAVEEDLYVNFEFKDGTTYKAGLGNAYKNYQSNPSDLKAVIQSYVKTLEEVASLNDAKFDTSRILPVIKSCDYVTQIERTYNVKQADSKFPFYFEKFNDQLCVLFAYDTPTSIRYLPRLDILEMGIKLDDIQTIAKENLKKIVPSLGLRGDPAKLSMLVADGVYEASFILFDGFWTKEQFPVKGDIVIFMPSRETVLVTGSKDQEGLAQARSILNDPEASWVYKISKSGFVRTKGLWKKF